MRAVDVLVVGAGPAGTTAARVIAEAGFSVLVVERSTRLGTSPCAGYLHRGPDVEVPDASVLESTIERMRTHLPDGSFHDFLIQGWVVDRGLFDRGLARGALLAGAHIITGAPLKRFDWQGGAVAEALCGRHRVEARVVVGADGVHSTTAKLLRLPPQPVVWCAQCDLFGVFAEEGWLRSSLMLVWLVVGMCGSIRFGVVCDWDLESLEAGLPLPCLRTTLSSVLAWGMPQCVLVWQVRILLAGFESGLCRVTWCWWGIAQRWLTLSLAPG